MSKPARALIISAQSPKETKRQLVFHCTALCYRMSNTLILCLQYNQEKVLIFSWGSLDSDLILGSGCGSGGGTVIHQIEGRWSNPNPCSIRDIMSLGKILNSNLLPVLFQWCVSVYEWLSLLISQAVGVLHGNLCHQCINVSVNADLCLKSVKLSLTLTCCQVKQQIDLE